MTRAESIERKRFINVLRQGGPAASARRLQQIERERLVSMQARSRIENARTLKRRIEHGHRSR